MHQCFSVKRKLVTIMLLVIATASELNAQDKQLLTPRDCTSIEYLASDDHSRQPTLQTSPDGLKLAYVVQVPDIAANHNETSLYVTDIHGKLPPDPTPVLRRKRIAGIHWFPDSRHIAALIEDHGRSILARIDVDSASIEPISDPTADISDYSMDSNGSVFAVSINVPSPHTLGPLPELSLETGYRVVSTPSGYAVPPPQRNIYIIRRTPTGRWDKAYHLTFVSPLSGKPISSLKVGGGMDISVSPNGKYLLMDNVETHDGLPARWLNSPNVSSLKNRWGFVLVSYLYDLSNNHVSIPLDSPVVRQHAVWSPDSHSFARVAVPPVGSIWESQDIEKGALSDHNTHLFTVDITTGTVSEVLQRSENAPLSWTESGNMLVRERDGYVRTLRQQGTNWEEKEAFRIPLSDLSPYSSLATDGSRVIGDYQNASTAPQLFEYDPKTAQLKVIAKLNPQVDELALPQIKRIQWTTSTGYKADGVLLLPPDYDPSREYPLVIENGSILYNGEFVCDSGLSHVSSFVRGMLADAGIIYLMRPWPGIDNLEQNFYPKGYPGGIAEAAFKLDLVESAIQYLDSRKMIDPGKVGIIGFSRGGWYTEYALAHSRIRYRAATVTDNVEYTYGAYWYFHSETMQQTYDAMYGGPPFGSTLKNWRDYSIEFNTDKIHTPLLKEVMGYGLREEDPQRPPNNLAAHFELFTALKRQNKPVEMYYYPDELHQVEHPVARMWSLRRNIDWFRFWLQGYERPNPEDPDQYKRWEHLKELRDADAQKTSDPVAPLH
jgi:dipeptidyl aminopeptidase/acylaminoacyl peptidase